jgi:hypothetical protein
MQLDLQEKKMGLTLLVDKMIVVELPQSSELLGNSA